MTLADQKEKTMHDNCILDAQLKTTKSVIYRFLTDDNLTFSDVMALKGCLITLALAIRLEGVFDELSAVVEAQIANAKTEKEVFHWMTLLNVCNALIQAEAEAAKDSYSPKENDDFGRSE